ncbi:hypothetical protein [Brucella anthropi]
MKHLFIGAMIAGLWVSTAAAETADCGNLNSQLLTIKDWAAKPGDFGSVSVSMTLQSNSDKQIRMLKAVALFVDPFGEQIANLALDPDTVIKPKAVLVEKGAWSAARLAKVRPQDVTAKICVSAVLYEDGSKEEFK